jgi:GT2 family glycosyltransferase
VTTPAIAVVVPTHDRASMLPRLVAALAAQDIAAPFEAIIVDDASTDDTSTALATLAAEHPWLRVERQDENAGPAAARNRGWRSARAPFVAFTDDDCVPNPSWLRLLAAQLVVADAVQGRTEGDPAQLPAHGPFGHTMTVTAGGSYETCNIAYRRAALDRAGGFDERFVLPYGEDTDLGLRVAGQGGRMAFCADAVVHHDVEPSDFWRYVRQRSRRADYVLAIRSHPRLRRELRMGLFTHPNALAAAAALALAASRPRDLRAAVPAALLVARYTRTTLRSVRPPARRAGWLAVVPLKFAADLYEVSVTARASIKYRTLVL